MGFLDSIKEKLSKKKQQQAQPQLPPAPPRPLSQSIENEQELVPPPSIIDFDEEIPDLPELEIPEDLGGAKEAPASVSQLKPENVPPPQAPKETEQEVPEIEIIAGEEGAEMPESGEKPKEKPVETSPKEEEEAPEEEKKEVEKPKEEKKHPLVEFIKHHIGRELFITEEAFAEVASNLDEINKTVSSSPHFKQLVEIDAQKEEAIKNFKANLQAIYETLEQIDTIAFGAR